MNVSSFSTSDFRPRDRLEVWSEQIWSAIGRLNTVAALEDEFRGTVKFGDAGVIKLCSVAVGPHRVERTPELIRRDDRGLLKVVFQIKGHTLIEQGGNQLLLSPQEWSIYDTSRPYRVSTSGAIELLAALIPRDRLIQNNPDVSRYTLQRFSSGMGLGRIVCRFMGSFLEDLPTLDSRYGPNLGETAIELVQLAIIEHMRSGSVLSASGMLKERIKTYINRHLRDPDFSLEMLAHAMHCSKRYLHKAFGEDAETLSQYLWNTRLERCRADLIDPELRSKSITAIAFSWGFSNAAHFSRSFRTRFGVTPSHFRQTNGVSSSARPSHGSVETLPTALDLGLRIASTS